MGIARLSLNLPSRSPSVEAVDLAARYLREQGHTDFSELTLQTILTTDEPGISRYTFTYWTPDKNTR